MKKLLIILSLIVLMQSNKVCAQITFDTAITHLTLGMGYGFSTVQISASETKYYIADTVTNTFSLYNMDFTPFQMNIAVPEPFLKGPTIFQAIYITRSLFDCDTSNIEYAYEAATDGFQAFYIMRTDGTQLFKLDSANGPYGFGDFLGGADWIKPIVNTSSGAKLFLQRSNAVYNGAIDIYSLCGELPEKVFDFTNGNPSNINIFPNPAAYSLTFQIHPPSNMDDYELVIVDENAKEVKRERVSQENANYTIDVRAFSSGTYFYSLCTKNKSIQNGKFIINK